MNLFDKIKAGDIGSIARLITQVERRDREAIRTIKEIYPYCGNAHLIGVTGPPGVGKSCLVSELARKFREKSRTVGILSVDPSSPFSGGALLGDRARMIGLAGDKDVFIRSLASRGASGGLSAAVNDVADILDRVGKDIVLIETVGVGQGEVDIARLAHTVMLVLVPGYGDTLQAMKAGIMEVADIFVINKSDKPGADETAAELSVVRHLQSEQDVEGRWLSPIVKTSALSGEGLDELTSWIQNHYKFIREKGLLAQKNRERRTRQFLDILTQRIRDEFMKVLETDPGLQNWVKKIGTLQLDPYSASEEVLDLVREARKQRKGSRSKSARR